MAPKLKLFRIPIGFHDAYVAATSQKAALTAWGADADLFARGIAQRVEDASIMKEASTQPGTVIRRSRGTAAQHLAAGGPSKATPKRSAGAKAARKYPSRPKPRPSRDALEKSEHALAEQQAALDADIGKLEAERTRITAAIAERRKSGARDAKALQADLDGARKTYESAMTRWRAQD